MLASRNTNAVNATVFTYSFGSNADKDLSKDIACGHSGVWTHVADHGNLLGTMSSYYEYLSFGIAGDMETVKWVEPYEFASTKEVFGCF